MQGCFSLRVMRHAVLKFKLFKLSLQRTQYNEIFRIIKLSLRPFFRYLTYIKTFRFNEFRNFGIMNEISPFLFVFNFIFPWNEMKAKIIKHSKIS